MSGVLKYRSLVDYKQIIDGDNEGFNLGIDGSIFIREEAIQRTFNAPRIGTQGKSTGATTPSTDISAGSNDTLKAAVDGAALVVVTLVLTGLTTGDAIAAELETKTNTALETAGQDGRVWAEYDSGSDYYVVYSQKTGTTSSVVITAGDSNDVAADLNLGVANAGTEAVGTDDQDFLLYTTGGPVSGQPIEPSPHRTGRFMNGVVKQKKTASFNITTLLNMSGSAGDSIDLALRTMLKSYFGTETVTAGVSIKYTQGLPNFTFSLVRVSTIFAEYYTGGYVKQLDANAPGDAPMELVFQGMAEKAVIAGIAQIDGIVTASTSVVLNTDSGERFEAGAYVMGVAADGRTILAGADGALKINSKAGDTMTLNTAVTLPDDGYLVPWHPGAVQQTGRENIYTDLEGSFKWSESQAADYCDVTNISFTGNNNHVDFNNRYGKEANVGFAAANRNDMNLSVEVDLNSQSFGKIVSLREFGGLDPELIVGDPAAGRYLKITAPNWIPAVPEIDVPENGTTPVTVEGNLHQSSAGARDPVAWEFL